MERLKEQLRALWSKVVEKKDVVIPVASAVVGAVLGAVVTSLFTNGSDDVPAFEDLIEEDED